VAGGGKKLRLGAVGAFRLFVLPRQLLHQIQVLEAQFEAAAYRLAVVAADAEHEQCVDDHRDARPDRRQGSHQQDPRHSGIVRQRQKGIVGRQKRRVEQRRTAEVTNRKAYRNIRCGSEYGANIQKPQEPSSTPLIAARTVKRIPQRRASDAGGRAS